MTVGDPPQPGRGGATGGSGGGIGTDDESSLGRQGGGGGGGGGGGAGGGGAGYGPLDTAEKENRKCCPLSPLHQVSAEAVTHVCLAPVVEEVEGVGLAFLQLRPSLVLHCDRPRSQGCGRRGGVVTALSCGAEQQCVCGRPYLGERTGQGGGEGEAESATPPSPSPL